MSHQSAPMLHGLAGLKSFQFVDPTDEDYFRHIDFEAMRTTHLLVNTVQIGLTLASHIAYAQSASSLDGSYLTAHLFAIFGLQILVRLRTYEGQPSRLGCFFCIMTCLQWLALHTADVNHDFVLLQSGTTFIIIFYFCFMCQAILVFHAFAYYLGHYIFMNLLAPCVILCYLKFGTRPDPTKPLLMSKTEFFTMCLLILYFAAVFIFATLYRRRVHHAQLQSIAELLRCEKERLQYDLVLAQRRSTEASLRLPEDRPGDADDMCSDSTLLSAGGSLVRRIGGPSRGVRLGPGSRGPGSSGCSSGMDELVAAVTELSEVRRYRLGMDALGLDEATLQRASPFETDAFLRREAALWNTLESSGIVPKEDPDRGSPAGSTQALSPELQLQREQGDEKKKNT